MLFPNNRSGTTTFRHSPEAQELSDFVNKTRSFHCLISSNDLLARELITDWTHLARSKSAITCIDASSYALLKERGLTPLEKAATNMCRVLIMFDSHRLSTHAIDDIIAEHAQESSIKLILCGNNGLRNAVIELGHSSEHFTLLTQQDVRITHSVLQRLLNEHKETHPELPNQPSPSLLTDIHQRAEGQVSRMESAFSRWLSNQKKHRLHLNQKRKFSFRIPLLPNVFSRRLAIQGMSLALIAGLGFGGWQQIRHVKTFAEPSVHSTQDSKAPYTVTLATSYSKKKLVSYQYKHHLPANKVKIRHVPGKKFKYELDLGSYGSHEKAVEAKHHFQQRPHHLM